MNTSTILVQIADQKWTLETLQAACVLAQKTEAQIILVQMVPVQHAPWLGSDWGLMSLNPQAVSTFARYQTFIEEHGVEGVPMLFQYSTWMEGTLQLVESANPSIIFVRAPESALPLWGGFQKWLMQRQFTRQGRRWIMTPQVDARPEASGAKRIPQTATL